MHLKIRWNRLTLALLFVVSSALAEVPDDLRSLVLTGDLNGRSSVNFKGSANVTSLVPKGTKADVLEVRKLSQTGSYGIRVKVTEPGRSKASNSVKKDQEVWVYYSQKQPWLSFKNLSDESTQDPEEALTTQAKRDGEALPALEGTVKNPNLPTREEVLRSSIDPNLAMPDKSKTEGEWCSPCDYTRDVKSENEKNIEQVEKVLQAVEPKATVKPAGKPTAKPSAKPASSDPQNIWANDPKIMRYSQSAGAVKTIRYAMNNKNGRSTGYCYRAVKRALVATGQVKKYPPGGHARDAVKDLKAQGWINLMDHPLYKNKIKSPADVPKGAVVVTWNSLKKESGDIAIKTDWGDKGGFVSEYFSPRSMMNQPKGRRYARKGQPYKMIGVMIKP